MVRARVGYWFIGVVVWFVLLVGLVAFFVGGVPEEVAKEARKDARSAVLELLWKSRDVVALPTGGDPEMVQARAKARATLGEFWRAVEAPGPGEEDFALKVAFAVPRKSSEHLWVENVERKDGRLFGVVRSEPRLLRELRRGQRIEFQEDQITDWAYMRSEKVVGGYTMLPLLKYLPADEAARYRAMLADP
jgi:uncharacterized protein YegJ (DUF2314 family)